ncbi:LysM peptidoglycan-binding domain-containing protein [Geobacter sp. FeAm09]|uniref:LysM peptidoglycan-binding domain-containing protein n=1 Tax=Geobacter sp. FeAm09 TaxID=2597769 RepID=UPI0011EEAAC2|nr:LysM peptidoglycan-binding domain-containing protein [Geobacter sp. FeAm09]QEM68497.1 LysM peptidoglycan-binding domain-containing protein [Geobacter sp. FeAm09]
MVRWLAAIPLLTCCFLVAACATQAPPPSWRLQAMALVDELSLRDGPRKFPVEYRNIVETFEHGEAVLQVQKNDKEADAYYLLALQKGDLLKVELQRLQKLAEEEARRQAAEQAARAEEERLLREAAQAEARLQEQNRLKAAAEAAAAKAKAASSKESPAPLPATYTVRRGETLPQIAGRAEIYNDVSLWPLIYRANRDQIRDPKRLWPGQVLTIPRHFSHDDAVEARRYSGKK